jgi:tetratricopeptide (TPR) repeat protein
MLRSASTNGGLLLSCARILMVLEQPKPAIDALEAYCQTKEGTSSIAALAALADLYRAAGDAGMSKQKIEQAQRVDPNHQAVVHARLGWLLWQKRWEELRGISADYIAATAQSPALLLGAASALATSNQAELQQEGLKLFEHAAARFPTSVEARLALASMLYRVGDAERAEKTYRQVLAQYPRQVRALNDLAWILQERSQRYEDALELAHQGLGVAPESVHLLDTRGTILSKMPNRLAEAKKDFEKLVQLSSSDPRRRTRALLQLGRVCARLEDLAPAKQHLQTALELDQQVHVLTPEERSQIAEILQRAAP